MRVIITAIGPDNRGLADPIVHCVTSAGANIAEIQMYDHDAERIFAMLLRMDWPAEREPIAALRERMHAIGQDKGLSIRTWSRDEHDRPPRLIPAATCWKFAGGRIINLHHGLLPAFPGAQPYRDAYSHRMLTYGATIHFIVPELDAGEQIIHQDTFTVAPGTPLAQIVRIGESDHEPACLVEG